MLICQIWLKTYVNDMKTTHIDNLLQHFKEVTKSLSRCLQLGRSMSIRIGLTSQPIADLMI